MHEPQPAEREELLLDLTSGGFLRPLPRIALVLAPLPKNCPLVLPISFAGQMNLSSKPCLSHLQAFAHILPCACHTLSPLCAPDSLSCTRAQLRCPFLHHVGSAWCH